jgi:hypothetical protein
MMILPAKLNKVGAGNQMDRLPGRTCSGFTVAMALMHLIL